MRLALVGLVTVVAAMTAAVTSSDAQFLAPLLHDGRQ